MIRIKPVNAGQVESTGRLFTIRDIAEFVGVSLMTVRRWIDSGELKIHRLGRLVRISQRDLDRFLASRRESNQSS